MYKEVNSVTFKYFLRHLVNCFVLSLLHLNQGLTREKKVKDINGKKMSAMTIFSMAINYMRKHLMELLMKQLTAIKQSDVMFVLTVPAIWSDGAKQFMRVAAISVSCLRHLIKVIKQTFGMNTRFYTKHIIDIFIHENTC